MDVEYNYKRGVGWVAGYKTRILEGVKLTIKPTPYANTLGYELPCNIPGCVTCQARRGR